MAKVIDRGPFYHGTKFKLKVDDYLRAGFASNYDSRVIMNHIYFTALKDGAGFAAQIAAGKDEVPHVYLVEPIGPYENDPNVTDWVPQPQDEIDILREKIATRVTNSKISLIN
ncbi:NAD(+)--rifampin ADP-ribosyltransferase [Lactococcus garvieae]|nr:NAD(+)--rifampin ADP-ribosyltransferase [Lactococcus garvieae]